MENKYAIILAIITLLIGGVVGSVYFSEEVEGETVYVNQTVEVETIVEVPVEAINLQDQALETFLAAIDDEEDEAGNSVAGLSCNSSEYDFSEISISNIDDDYTVDYDRNSQIVTIDVRLKYKESEFRSCRTSYDVQVTYEDNEDSLVTIL